MRNLLLTAALFGTLLALNSCDPQGCTDSTADNYDQNAVNDDGSCVYEPVLGRVTMNIPANGDITGSGEALAGNLLADAIYSYATSQGNAADFVLIPNEQIDYSATERPSGVYNAGDWTLSMVEEFVPDNNTLLIIDVDAVQLKEILERSVSNLPISSSFMLQNSSHISYLVDQSQTGQIVSSDNSSILQSGSRISEIRVGGSSLDSTATYSVLTTSDIETPSYGYITLNMLSASQKTSFVSLTTMGAMVDYLENHSPITVDLEDRIRMK